jgi:uncharacterized membrane protein YccC
MGQEGKQRAKEHFRQAVKTGIAGMASIALADFLRLHEGYWAAISAVIVMQSNIGAAIGAAWSRLAGTAIGAFAGALFVVVWGINAPSFGVAVTLAVLACAFLGLLDSYRLAGATVAIVMLSGSHDIPWIVALNRFFEVSLGIIIALLVTVFIWPARARKNLLNGIVDAVSGINDLYRAIIGRYRGEADAPVEELRSQVARILQNNENLQKQTMYEPRLGPERKELLFLLMDHVHRILHALDALGSTAHVRAGSTLNEKYEPELGELIGRIGEAITRLGKEISAWHFTLPGDDLDPAIVSLEGKTLEIRKARLTAEHDMEEILHYYSLFHALRHLARELDQAREAGGRWISSGD